MDTASRRRAIQAIAAASVGYGAWLRLLAAAEALSPQDAMARQFQYTEDAATVDRSKAANFKPESRCGNCVFYLKAQAAEGHAPCAMFGSKLVPEKGWCSVWAKAP